MELLSTINGIDLALFAGLWLFATLWLTNKARPSEQPVQQGEQYFNDELAHHVNCSLDITEYLCSCGKISYRLLRCNEASDCVDEAVGIAVQFEHDCHK